MYNIKTMEIKSQRAWYILIIDFSLQYSAMCRDWKTEIHLMVKGLEVMLNKKHLKESETLLVTYVA